MHRALQPLGHDGRAVQRSTVLWLFVAASAFFLLFGNGIPKAGDEKSMRELTRSMVVEQSVEVPDEPFVGVPGADGRTVSKYGIGQPVLSLPFELLGRAMSAPLENPEPVRTATTVAVIPLATGALVAWSYVLARRLGSRPLDALGLSVAAVVGTPLFVYGTEYFSEPLLALLLVISVERALAGRWTVAFAALTVAMIVHARAAPLLAVLGFIALRQIGLRRTIRSTWPVAVGLLVLATYSLVRFGSLLDTGYDDEGFTMPIVVGLDGLFFTTSKSVLVFAPIALIGVALLPRLWRRCQTGSVLIGGYSLLVLVMTATWHSWMGGWSWGPRLLVPVFGLAALALGPWLSQDRLRWTPVLAACAVGLAASLPALLVPSTLQKDLPNAGIGPEVVRQYELVPDVIRSGVEGECAGAVADALIQDCMPALWQVHVARSVGPIGDSIVAAASLLLVVLGGFACVRCCKLVTAADHSAEEPSVGARPSADGGF